MFPLIVRSGQRGVHGFTLIEALVVLAIFGVLLALGVPRMTLWILSTKAQAATELYAAGFKLARQQALSHNAVTRLVLLPNAGNGQMDWQVDLCFSRPGVLCSNESGAWSTTTTVASADPEGTGGFTSVFAAADALPSAAILQPSLLPEGSTSVYFNASGWVDTTFGQRLSRMQFDPAPAYAGQLRASALVIGLAGGVIKCDPAAAATDSRACPP